MKQRIEIQIPYPPSVNHLYGQRGNRRFIKKKGVEFFEKVKEIVSQKVFAQFLGDVSVTAHLYPPDRRKRDIDNTLKAILDSLQKAGVYKNDNQVKQLFVARINAVKGGRVDLIVEEM